MQLRKVRILQLLQNHRTGNSSVGLVIIGHMQRRIRAEGIVNVDSQRMFPRRKLLYHCRKRGIGIVMLRYPHIIKIYLCRMADPLKFQAYVAFAGKSSFINSLSPVG